jgi:integrase
MAITPSSRNGFADPSLLTFADLITRVEADKTLPLRTRQNWAWALRVVARAIGKDPVAVPAHPEFLRPLLRQAAPASIPLTRAGWNNARSLLSGALQWAGVASLPGHYQAPFSPLWVELWTKLPPNTAMSFQLSRLFHWASAQGIEPADMNDAALARFHQDLVSESIVRLPYETYRGAAKSWNNAVEDIPGWPKQRLTAPSRARIFSLPWSAFPASFAKDLEAYLRRAEGLDLTDDHFTRAQRPATLKTRRAQLRLLASAIHKSGVPLDALVDLRAMLRPVAAAAGLQFLLARNDGVSSVQISNLADFLPTLARRLDVPGEDIVKLNRMKKKLRVTQRGMTARNREALRAFDGQAAVNALVNLPQRLWNEVRASGHTGARAAKIIQTALSIELLIHAPVRIQNLASLDLERHLVGVGAGTAKTLHLVFPAWEVKNRNSLEFPLVDATLELLDEYLTVWRPLLVGEPTTFLFPGKNAGRPKGSAALSSQIKELVHAYTRLDMPAHRFRHAVGKIFLDRNPGQYEVVRQLLGHKDITTTITFYAGAESASAARHYARTILDIRGGGLGRETRHA